MKTTIDPTRIGQAVLALVMGVMLFAASGCASCCCADCMQKKADAAKGAHDHGDAAPAPTDAHADHAAAEPEPAWTSLFDGESLGHWKPSEFGGNGEVTVEEGHIRMAIGSPLTGVTWDGEPPMKLDYEIEFDAQRIDGSDFFVGLTFPVGDKPCTLIMGGWVGGMTGLSSIDNYDASENATSQWIKYHNGRWYHVRLRVTANRINAWLDGKPIIDADIEGHELSIRIEVDNSRPLGFAAFTSTAAVKNIRWRPIASPE